MLWAWLGAWQRRSLALAFAAGAIFAVGCTMGLVHIWVAFTMALATLWEAVHNGRSTVVLRLVLAAGAGAIAICAIAYVALDWNIPHTLYAVWWRWDAIQKTFDMNRRTWYAIGFPIFLLFLSPGFWTPLGLALRRGRRINLGTRLALCTAVVMLVIYLPLGVTYELPRLWIPFIPPLVLGLMASRPLLSLQPKRAATAALVTIVLVQVVFTALHWTLIDGRESEHRLTERRYYN
jgi:hypothetical protein